MTLSESEVMFKKSVLGLGLLLYSFEGVDLPLCVLLSCIRGPAVMIT